MNKQQQASTKVQVCEVSNHYSARKSCNGHSHLPKSQPWGDANSESKVATQYNDNSTPRELDHIFTWSSERSHRHNLKYK